MKEAVGEPFLLQNLIVPVALVDPPSLTAIVTPMAQDVPVTAGELTAPAANTRLADTGALGAGQYNVVVWAVAADQANIRLRRRNAGDTADIWSQLIAAVNGVGANGWVENLIPAAFRVVLAANERLVVENSIAGTAGRVFQASIWTQGPF
jgi:hypothetical protein